MKKTILPFLAALILFSCNKPGTSNVDANFNQLSEDYLKGYLDWRPANGTSLGFHQYDGKVTDLSKASIAAELVRLKDFDQKFAALDTAAMSAQIFMDYRLLRSSIKNEISGFEDTQPLFKNPMSYAGAVDVSIYVKRNFAPIENRLRSIIAIEKKAPELFADAKANLQDTLAIPHTQIAIQIARGTADFLRRRPEGSLKRCEE